MIFYKLHSILKAKLKTYLYPKGCTKYDPTGGAKMDPYTNAYQTKTTIWLSTVISYFEYGSQLDITIMNHISLPSVFKSVSEVVEFVNNCKELEFYLTSHEDQTLISNGSKEMIGTYFDNVIDSIYGILIWILNPHFSNSERQAI